MNKEYVYKDNKQVIVNTDHGLKIELNNTYLEQRLSLENEIESIQEK